SDARVGCDSGCQGEPTWLEWPISLNVEKLLTDGWHSTPFRQFIIKIHSRCNLACHYCYMYELADQSWRMRPRTMSSALITVASMRIAEHARTHNLDSVRIIFHGGEPLLSGANLIIDAFDNIR